MTTHAAEMTHANEMLAKITGYWVSQAIYASAKLGVADLLGGGPRPAAELAGSVGAHGDALYRLLRALSSVGVFTEVERGTFGLTPLGELLRSDHPYSLRPLSLMFGDLQYEAWGDILVSITTGKCAYEQRTGGEFFDHLKDNPKAARTFSDAMTSFLQSIPRSVIEVYDFSSFRKVVDVGAAHGTLLSAILKRYPDVRGVLFDLPHVTEAAREHVDHKGLSSRIDLVGGDFLESVPAGGDAYILSTIIHDWDDERSIKILKNCRSAIDPNGRLLLVEMIIRDGNDPFFGKWLDLHMLVMHGGRDRTEAEYARLLEASGFELRRIIPTSFLRSVIEAVPV